MRNIEVNCGTRYECDDCPLMELAPAKANYLGRIAACFTGLEPTMENLVTADQIIDNSEIKLEIWDINKTIKVSEKMTNNECEIRRED